MDEKPAIRHNVFHTTRTQADLATFLDALARDGWTVISVAPRWLQGTHGLALGLDEFLIVARREDGK